MLNSVDLTHTTHFQKKKEKELFMSLARPMITHFKNRVDKADAYFCGGKSNILASILVFNFQRVKYILLLE